MAWLVKYWVHDEGDTILEGRWFFNKAYNVSEVLSEMSAALTDMQNVIKFEVKKEDT